MCKYFSVVVSGGDIYNIYTIYIIYIIYQIGTKPCTSGRRCPGLSWGHGDTAASLVRMVTSHREPGTGTGTGTGTGYLVLVTLITQLQMAADWEVLDDRYRGHSSATGVTSPPGIFYIIS